MVVVSAHAMAAKVAAARPILGVKTGSITRTGAAYFFMNSSILFF
jgi:hypothetical protein